MSSGTVIICFVLWAFFLLLWFAAVFSSTISMSSCPGRTFATSSIHSASTGLCKGDIAHLPVVCLIHLIHQMHYSDFSPLDIFPYFQSVPTLPHSGHSSWILCRLDALSTSSSISFRIISPALTIYQLLSFVFPHVLLGFSQAWYLCFSWLYSFVTILCGVFSLAWWRLGPDCSAMLFTTNASSCLQWHPSCSWMVVHTSFSA